MTPGVYRKGGEGMSIRYTVTACPLGRLLVATTDRGVCFVSLGASDAPLERALHAEYPRAAIARDSGALSRWAGELASFVRGQQTRLDLPLDLQATAFQLRVWEELRRIPYGETRSYADVARRLGKPAATRAVARACATNPAPLVTPCHRVIREDGDLAGYRWGVDRKRALLAMEQAKQ
jgi:AraC family transcriptional regulator of adaptative response/methylated-DNA-[protein]-cysteine methyltransferase